MAFPIIPTNNDEPIIPTSNDETSVNDGISPLTSEINSVGDAVTDLEDNGCLVISVNTLMVVDYGKMTFLVEYDDFRKVAFNQKVVYRTSETLDGFLDVDKLFTFTDDDIMMVWWLH